MQQRETAPWLPIAVASEIAVGHIGKLAIVKGDYVPQSCVKQFVL